MADEFDPEPPAGERSMGIVLGSKLKKRLRKLSKAEDRTLSATIRVLLVEALVARDEKLKAKKEKEELEQELDLAS